MMRTYTAIRTCPTCGLSVVGYGDCPRSAATDAQGRLLRHGKVHSEDAWTQSSTAIATQSQPSRLR